MYTIFYTTMINSPEVIRNQFSLADLTDNACSDGTICYSLIDFTYHTLHCLSKLVNNDVQHADDTNVCCQEAIHCSLSLLRSTVKVHNI